jgi:hypothetical protein
LGVGTIPDVTAISNVDVQSRTQPYSKYTSFVDYTPEITVIPRSRTTPEPRTNPYIDYVTDDTPIIQETKITPPDNRQPEPTPKPPEPIIPPPIITGFPIPPLGGGGGGGGAAASKPGQKSIYAARFQYGQGIGGFGSISPIRFGSPGKSAPAPRKKSRRK